MRSDAEAALVAQFDKSWADHQGFRQRVIKFGRDGDPQDAADIADGASSMGFDESLTHLNELLSFNQAGGKAAAQSAETAYEQGLMAIAVLLAGAVLVGITLALVITRSLVGRLGGEPRAAVEVARVVAEGDLTTSIQVQPGDTDSLMAWLQNMQRGLADAVTAVRQRSEFIASASMQIAQGNQDLSSRTEQQASALPQTAATMEALGSTVRHNADNARRASQLAQSASSVARQGGEVVGEVVDTMKGINDSSRKIADIIGVIDGIAFRTNILALNAAVEAARAGAQGRGFAVVAGEVRSLAQRSAEAAKAIKGLITTSVERVEHGSTLVDRAGQTMGEIVDAIGRVTDIVGEISAARVEQSAGVSQVGQAITEMDCGTQQDAALVEQSATGAESLKQQAPQLVQSVAVFRTTAGSAPALPAVAPATRPKAVFAARPTTPSAPRTTPPADRPVAVAAAKPVARPAPAPAVVGTGTATATAAATVGDDDDWQSF